MYAYHTPVPACAGAVVSSAHVESEAALLGLNILSASWLFRGLEALENGALF
jgi:hypothetical protein